ncbi:hypothetical protein TYRP_009482 [Tyrophagus putrescentiae]|nr:hypothetical protein TYRP_009482 [Tyrophagus putrescentiae]
MTTYVELRPNANFDRPLAGEPDQLGLNGLGHLIPLVISFPTIPNLSSSFILRNNVIIIVDFSKSFVSSSEDVADGQLLQLLKRYYSRLITTTTNFVEMIMISIISHHCSLFTPLFSVFGKSNTISSGGFLRVLAGDNHIWLNFELTIDDRVLLLEQEQLQQKQSPQLDIGHQ